MKKTFTQLVIEFKEVEGVFISSKKQSIVTIGVLTLHWSGRHGGRISYIMYSDDIISSMKIVSTTLLDFCEGLNIIAISIV